MPYIDLEILMHEVNFGKFFFFLACNQLFKTLTKDFNDLDTYYLLKLLFLFAWGHVFLTSNKIIIAYCYS